jgi:hypothetical protein
LQNTILPSNLLRPACSFAQERKRTNFQGNNEDLSPFQNQTKYGGFYRIGCFSDDKIKTFKKASFFVHKSR